MELLIKNVCIINFDGKQLDTDLLIVDAKIAKIGKNISAKCEQIDAGGLYAFPGFIDMHCHLRDPGFTHKEDIASGTKSAATGGFTTICCMPNTKPATDRVEIIRDIKNRADSAGFVRVLPVAAITKGLLGEELTDFEALKQAGVIALSDDGMPVQDDAIIMEAMDRAKELNILLTLHEEDLKNRGAGVANMGKNAEIAGLEGIANAIEDSMTARDIFYAQLKSAKIHLCHVSTAGSVELVRRAKQNGVEVTCETGPHYFSLADEAIKEGNPNAKMNPPLRSEADRHAIVAGLKDGTIDAIATDHAPHTQQEKAVGFKDAPFGIIGFETTFSLAMQLIKNGEIGVEDIARLLSANPAKILGIDGGKIAEGERADITLCDIDAKYIYSEDSIVSKSKNSPFIGKELVGRVIYTILEGKITHNANDNR